MFSSSKSSWGTNIPRFGAVIQSSQKKMMNSPLMFETLFWRIYLLANKGWLTFNSKLKPELSFDGFPFLVRIPSSYPLKFSSATLSPKICVYLWAHIYRAPPLLLLVAPKKTSKHRHIETMKPNPAASSPRLPWVANVELTRCFGVCWVLEASDAGFFNLFKMEGSRAKQIRSW